VGKFGGEKVHQRVKVEEKCLTYAYEESEEGAMVSHCQENEKMHSFILSFLKKMMDPSVVCFKCS
jgi:hypothetical protein